MSEKGAEMGSYLYRTEVYLRESSKEIWKIHGGKYACRRMGTD